MNVVLDIIKDSITPIIALLGGIPGYFAIKKNLFKTSIHIAFDEKQSFVCAIDSDSDKINGKYCLGFYVLGLVGASDLPTTPKELKLFLKIGRKWIEGIKIKIRTYLVEGKENCAVLDNGADKLILANWCNLENVMEPLSYGSPVLRSTAFCFDKSLDEIEGCSKMKFVVLDYFGTKHVNKIKIPKRMFNMAKRNFKLIDKQNYAIPNS